MLVIFQTFHSNFELNKAEMQTDLAGDCLKSVKLHSFSNERQDFNKVWWQFWGESVPLLPHFWRLILERLPWIFERREEDEEFTRANLCKHSFCSDTFQLFSLEFFCSVAFAVLSEMSGLLQGLPLRFTQTFLSAWGYSVITLVIL